MCFTEGRNARNKIGMSVIRRHEGGWDEGGWDPNGTSALRSVPTGRRGAADRTHQM